MTLTGASGAEKAEPSAPHQEPEGQFPGGKKPGAPWWSDLPWWAKALMAWGVVAALGLLLKLLLPLLKDDTAGLMDPSVRELPIEGVKAQVMELLTRGEELIMRLVQYSLIAKVLLVLLAGVPFILLFGTIYHKLTGIPIKKALLRCYALINRLPGCGSVIGEETLAAAVLINFVYYMGLFTFVTFIGFVTQDVRETYRQVQNGLYPVLKAGHTVILHWNEHTPMVLQNLARGKLKSPDNPFFQRPVTILADRPKADMDAEVRDIPLEIHTRKGSPLIARDLKMVSADKASTVIIMQPTLRPDATTAVSSQTQVAAAAMAVAALSPEGRASQQRLLLQSPILRGTWSLSEFQTESSGGFLSAATSICGSTVKASRGAVETVKLEKVDFAHRFATLATLQPGIVEIYKEILSPGGATLGSQPLPAALEGASYREARRSFDKAIVCGFVRDGVVNMLPYETDALRPGDYLITLSKTFRPAPLSKTSASIFESHCSRNAHGDETYHIGPRKVIVVLMEKSNSKNRKVLANFARDFEEFAPEGSQAIFVVPCSKDKDLELDLPPGRCKFSVLMAKEQNPTSRAVLAEAGIKDADSVLIAGLHQLTNAEADAFVMASLLQVLDASRASGRGGPPHFVARVRNASTDVAINGFIQAYRKALPPDEQPSVIDRPDLMESDQLIASILAQSASCPDYLPLMTHLLNSSVGAEVYLRDPRAYCLSFAGVPLTFAEVAETARLHHETAIGYRRADGTDVLVLEPSHELTLHPGDKLVVFADDFCVAPRSGSNGGGTAAAGESVHAFPHGLQSLGP